MSASSIPKEVEKKAFIELPAEYRKDYFTTCQRKGHVPIVITDRGLGLLLSFMIREGPNRGRPEVPVIRTLDSYGPETRKNYFDISEIPDIRFVKKRKAGGPSRWGYYYTFAVGDRRQEIFCNLAGCGVFNIKADGLLYQVEPRRYWVKGVMDVYETVDPEDMPEYVIPVLDLIRGYRNHSVEADYR